LQTGVRQYENVHFVRDNSRLIPPELAKKKRVRDVEGVLVNLNFEKNKKLKSTDWVHCRRFMFGSLLCFSMDKFQTLHLATVVDRDMDYLEAGFFRIQFCETPSVNFYSSPYTMIESEVFFDPYNHVLRTLQTFQENDFPFAEYIVKYQSDVYPPSYLEVEPPVNYQFPNIRVPVTVLEPNSWPTLNELDLDESQYRALYLALTREMAVIQGPPGTGKTFIGLKVAQILVENRAVSNRTTPILVVCLTNHALDQFLVGISKFTSKIVRIGGQSKSEEMAKFNLRMLRRHSRLHSSRFGDAKREIETYRRQLQDVDLSLKELRKGIVDYEFMVKSGAAPGALFLNGTQFVMWLLGSGVKLSPSKLGSLTFVLTLYDLESCLKDLDHASRNASLFDLQNLVLERGNIEKIIQILKEKLENTLPASKKEASDFTRRLHSLNLNDKWKLYMHWAQNAENDLLRNAAQMEKEINVLEKQLEELQVVEDLEILREADVVGMTTSGAARLQRLMRDLGSEIGNITIYSQSKYL